MSLTDRIQLLHVAAVLRESPPGLKREVELYRKLPAGQRPALAGHAARIAESLQEQGLEVVDPVLLEVACLAPSSLQEDTDPLSFLEEGGELSPRKLRVAQRRAERAAAALAFYRNLAPSRRRELAGLTDPPLDLPEKPETLDLLALLDRLALALPSPSPREISLLYRQISTAEGRELAAGAAELLTGHAPGERELAERMLVLLSCLVPGSLEGLHERLVRQGTLHPGELFRSAGAETRDLFLEMLPPADVDQAALILSALAWIGDELVRIRFHQWREAPPEWAVPLDPPPDLHSLDAGWHLELDGTRRDLYHEECYELIAADGATAGAVASPVQVITPHEERCPGCKQPLVTLFDFGLRDRRLAFVDLEGSRLRIATCLHCIPYSAPILTEIDGQGGSHWSLLNEKPIFVADEIGPLPERALVLGERLKTPFATRPFALEGNASQVGGCPAWLQEAEFPLCPECAEPMRFLAQLHLADVGAALEGILYGFLCHACRLAATLYQQP
ncbi:MAG TPA: hypothetical protein VF756_11290 [Thermoanaerobaculia bacterium]